MNNISKIGLIMEVSASIAILILMLILHKGVPRFLLYLFNYGLILTYFGVFIQAGKDRTR